MKSLLLSAVAIVIACLSGWAHGLLTDRWGVPVEVRAIGRQLEEFVPEVEGWTSEVARTIDDHTRRTAGAEGYFSRVYTHGQTGATVHVTILCGRSGPISLHTPDVCFVGSGMTQLVNATRTILSRESTAAGSADVPAEFLMADYRPPASKPGPDIKTFWSWSTDGQSWSAPENPRLTFSRSPSLYRFYFTAPSNQFPVAAEDEETPNPVKDFMPEFLKRFAELTRSTEK
ncbi:MAG: exosortase-associated EpsI family protein [Planctomycetaceae bacterium]